MKNLHKSPGTGAPAALSTGHRHYLRHYHFHGLLKMKESMIWCDAQNSQRNKNPVKRKIRKNITSSL